MDNCRITLNLAIHCTEQIAKTYGLSSFPQIEQIRYTFNVDLGQIKLTPRDMYELFVEVRDRKLKLAQSLFAGLSVMGCVL